MPSDEHDALVNEYRRSQAVEETFVYLRIPWVLLRRVGVDPLSWRGRLLFGLLQFGWVFAGAVVVALATGTLRESPLLAWLTVPVIEAVLGVWFTGALRDVLG